MSNQFPHFKELTGTTTSAGSTSEIPLPITPSWQSPVEVVRVTVDWLTGSAASFQPRIGTRASFNTGSVQETYVASSTAVASKVDDTNISSFCLTNATGSLFLRPGPNTGSDNSFEYSIIVKVY